MLIRIMREQRTTPQKLTTVVRDPKAYGIGS